LTVRVNAGGGTYADPQGNVWSADAGYNGGAIYSTTHTIAGTTTPTLYQTVRYHSLPLQYQFTLPNGNYTVKLKFAEIYFTTAGKRKFNVSINGQAALANFDVVAAAGGAFLAMDREFPVSVSNGQIVIRFTAVVNNPNVNAIEITGASATALARTGGQGPAAE
jgi:hypothetical protein